MENPESGLPITPAASLGLQVIGVVLALASAVAFAMVPTFAKLAYAGGSNTLTVITARSILAVALIWLVMISLRQPMHIDRKPMLISLSAGIFYAIMAYGSLGSLAFIPVNTAILILFTHPILVGLVTAYLGEEAISLKVLVALVVAFTGLGLAIGFSLESLNLSGIALAALSAIAIVFVIVGNARAMKQASGIVVVFYMMGSAAVTQCILFLIFGTYTPPVTALGWLGFGGVAIASTAANLAFFGAVPILGAVRATMITNIEPLLAIVFAVLILGERISILQGVGIAMVLTAIAAVEFSRR